MVRRVDAVVRLGVLVVPVVAAGVAMAAVVVVLSWFLLPRAGVWSPRSDGSDGSAAVEVEAWGRSGVAAAATAGLAMGGKGALDPLRGGFQTSPSPDFFMDGVGSPPVGVGVAIALAGGASRRKDEARTAVEAGVGRCPVVFLGAEKDEEDENDEEDPMVG